jgi:hypothetical protein
MIPSTGVTPSGPKTCPVTTNRSPDSLASVIVPTELTFAGAGGVGGGPLAHRRPFIIVNDANTPHIPENALTESRIFCPLIFCWIAAGFVSAWRCAAPSGAAKKPRRRAKRREPFRAVNQNHKTKSF